MLKKFFNKNTQVINNNDNDNDNNNKEQINSIIERAKKSSDFTFLSLASNKEKMIIYYYRTLIDSEILKRDFLPYIKPKADQIKTLQELSSYIPLEQMLITDDVLEINSRLNKGSVLIQLHKDDKNVLMVDLSAITKGYRQANDTENEFSVVGPKVGFIENIGTNLYLLRQNIVSSDLIFEEITIGSLSKTKVVLAYIDGVTNPQYVNTARQRLSEVDFDAVFDSSNLEQAISDNSNTPFPILLTTERVDRATYALILGQVAILVDGSPYVITGPTTLLDFFISPEDYFLPWIVGTFFRVIRLLGVIFSVFATPVYVAVLTFHYEVIPQDLLGPLINSRSNVPFPPILEVIFLELTIELLREAGARLPNKIGQTLGIVGGIVIGQASVEAALTSSVLLIVVALSALASFTTPIFKMSNTIRIIRFPFILLAAIWGGLGIVIGLVFLLAHLLRIKSLGNPYLVPIFPFRSNDYADSVIRSSFEIMKKRPSYLRPLLMSKYHPKKNKDVKEGINNE
jgi:hypothetical protein